MKIKQTIGYHVIVMTNRKTGEQLIATAPDVKEVEVTGLKQLPLVCLKAASKLFGVDTNGQR